MYIVYIIRNYFSSVNFETQDKMRIYFFINIFIFDCFYLNFIFIN